MAKVYRWEYMGYICGHNHRSFQAAVKCGKSIIRASTKQSFYRSEYISKIPVEDAYIYVEGRVI